MANININVEEFKCESPIVGNTYRSNSTGGEYIFNWTSKGDDYATIGVPSEMRLYYTGDGAPETQYTGQPIPFDADNFNIGPLFFDIAEFRLEFLVEGGNTCYYSINIPSSSIIII